MVRGHACFPVSWQRTYRSKLCRPDLWPQLNNYRDLVKPIQEPDQNEAEPLSQEEARIIYRVAEKFPTDPAVYDAAHREKIWVNSRTGALIPYSCASELTEI
jgi:hypothetical protein